jgi:hypothetical protein
MPKQWQHYEEAFEQYLKFRKVPHVCVDMARQCLPAPPGERTLRLPGPPTGVDNGTALKFFDYVVYGAETNLLVEVKGRRIPPRASSNEGTKPARGPRLECWTTLDDLGSLQRWKTLFGPGFEPLLVFVYWCEAEPPTFLFQEIFEYNRRWYALRSIRIEDYIAAMKVRSLKWRTVDLSPKDFENISNPFAPPTPNPLPKDSSLTNQVMSRARQQGPDLPDPAALVERLTRPNGPPKKPLSKPGTLPPHTRP